MNIVVVIPAFNEARAVGSVVETLLKTNLPGSIYPVVVDDGSSDDTAAIARKSGADVVCHPINGGVGVATITGMATARVFDASLVVTMDADGQHNPNEIPQLIAPILTGKADIVVGSRLIDPGNMPLVRRIGNQATNFLLNRISGLNTTDSQSGYRAYNRHAIETLELHTSGFEVCTEILLAAKRTRLRVTEVPIQTIYTDYSLRKGQSVSTAVMTVLRIIKQFIVR